MMISKQLLNETKPAVFVQFLLETVVLNQEARTARMQQFLWVIVLACSCTHCLFLWKYCFITGKLLSHKLLFYHSEWPVFLFSIKAKFQTVFRNIGKNLTVSKCAYIDRDIFLYDGANKLEGEDCFQTWTASLLLKWTLIAALFVSISSRKPTISGTAC